MICSSHRVGFIWSSNFPFTNSFTYKFGLRVEDKWTVNLSWLPVSSHKAAGAVAKTSELLSSGMEIEIAELVSGSMTSKKEKIQKKIKNKMKKTRVSVIENGKDDDKKMENMEIEVDSDSTFEVNVRSKSAPTQYCHYMNTKYYTLHTLFKNGNDGLKMKKTRVSVIENGKDDDKKMENMEIEVDSDSTFEVNVRSKSAPTQYCHYMNTKYYTLHTLFKNGNDGLKMKKTRVSVIENGKDDDKKMENMEIEVDSDSTFEVNVRSKSEVSQGDDVVHCKYGEKSAQSLSSAGFRYVAFKSYEGLGHYTVPREMGEVSTWLSSRLGFEGFSV
ncbi:lysophospholipase [Trifolium repens]|nr:lysophospholipase [Trifolium repens]